MEIPIKISETMNKEATKNYSYENRIVRIPAVSREKYKLKLYDFVTLRDHFGKLLTLQIVEAYKEDVLVNPLMAFVTKKVYDGLYFTNDRVKRNT